MSIDDRINYEARLEALEAYATASEDGLEAGLNRAASSNDPEVVRRKLGLMLSNGRISDAADLIREAEPHARWCDTAITILVRNGDIEAADRYLKWALQHNDTTTLTRCRVMYANALLVRAFANRTPGEPILPGELSLGERALLERIFEVLQPTLTVIEAQQSVSSELHSLSLQIAVRAFVHLGDITSASKYAAILETRQPVPIELADLAASRLIPCSEELPARLRTEHPLSPQAKVLAALIEGDILGKHEVAFRHCLDISATRLSHKEKTQLCLLATQLAKEIGPTEESEATKFAQSILGEDDPFFDRLEVERLAREGRFDEATQKLEQIRDENSSVWLQLAAQLAHLRGDDAEATDYFAKAAEKHPHPALLDMVASLAYKQSRFDLAIEALEKAIAFAPHDPIPRKNAAMTYYQVSEFRKAASHFEVLRQLEPSEVDHALNCAACLAFSGQLEKSLEVYASVTSSPTAPLRAIAGQSQVLVAMRRGKLAYQLVNSVRSEYWNVPQFLVLFMSIAHVAGEDEKAHEALQELIRLRGTSEDAATLIQPKTLDDFKESVSAHRKNREYLHGQMIHGKAPWVFVDGLLGDVPYWGWFQRTQSLAWIAETPQVRAENCIYATNSFLALESDNGSRSLERIECPREGSHVTADISALITLHRLDLLEALSSYFTEIHISGAYQKAAFQHRERLTPHQLSQIDSRRTIRKALDEGRIRVASITERKALLDQAASVDEYAADHEREPGARGIEDLLTVLGEQGLATSDTLEHVRKHVRHVDNDSLPSLQPSQSVLIDGGTLTSLVGFEIFDEVIRAFGVHITNTDEASLRNELLAYNARDDVARWHDELWTYVRDRVTFIEVPFVELAELTSDKDDGIDARDLGLAAALYASKKKIPLIADDRVCQALALNESRIDSSAAFGSDMFLKRLFETGKINRRQLTDSFLKLVKWRYRFLLPPPEVLQEAAERYRTNLPGSDLRCLALYVHDCMRDAGLFGGLENTEPKMPIAFRYFTGWLFLITNLIVHVWLVEKWPETQASHLTEWSIREFLPSMPKSLGNWSAQLAMNVPVLVLTHVSMLTIEYEDYEQANKCLRTVASALNLSDDEFLRIIAEVVNAI